VTKTGQVATSAQEELEFLETWRPLPGQEANPVFAQLVANEFLDPEQQTQTLVARLGGNLEYSAQVIPYYRELFESIGFRADRFGSLTELGRLPVMTRFDAVSAFERLQAPAHALAGQHPKVVSTSGSTGLPVRVLTTAYSRDLLGVIWQRYARWARLDLTRRFARIRIPQNLHRGPLGELLPDGKFMVSPRWTWSGRYFATGDEIQFNISNPRARQLEWLARFRPAYLLSYPTLLEELALANECRPLPGLEAVMPVSSMLTSTVRARLDQSFGVPIHQNYGLNEAGIVATRCAAGRYHVAIENAWVEVVDAEGQAVHPGASGRLLVTTLSNRAMPLYRYDTGDLATASEGVCACGRTSPGFQDILGRFIRFVGTPADTRPRLNGLLAVLSSSPNELFENLRQYQFYQTGEQDFELRMVTAGPLHPEFKTRLQAAWAELNRAWGERELRFIEVDAIDPTPSGKQLDFMSAFHPLDSEFGNPDETPPPTA